MVPPLGLGWLRDCCSRLQPWSRGERKRGKGPRVSDTIIRTGATREERQSIRVSAPRIGTTLGIATRRPTRGRFCTRHKITITTEPRG